MLLKRLVHHYSPLDLSSYTPPSRAPREAKVNLTGDGFRLEIRLQVGEPDFVGRQKHLLLDLFVAVLVTHFIYLNYYPPVLPSLSLFQPLIYRALKPPRKAFPSREGAFLRYLAREDGRWVLREV